MFGIFSAFYDVQFQASYHQNWSHSFWWSPSKTLTKLIHYVFSSIIIILFPLSLFYFTLGNCFLFPNSSQSSIFLDNMQRNAALISIMYADQDIEEIIQKAFFVLNFLSELCLGILKTNQEEKINFSGAFSVESTFCGG